MSEKLQWFRLYSEIVDDEKLRLLAFEDRWHYIAILSLKASGLLDEDGNPELKKRRVAVKMGLSTREVDEVARRLAEVELIDRETLQPLAWDKRQYKSDNSTERVRKHRDNKRNEAKNTCNVSGNVSVTPPETETETENPPLTPHVAADAAQPADAGHAPGKSLNKVNYQTILQAYNDSLGDALPMARELTAARQRAIASRFREYVGTSGPSGKIRFTGQDDAPAFFAAVFRKVKLNPHWIGENERGWRADFDWLMKPANFVKVLEYVPAKRGDA